MKYKALINIVLEDGYVDKSFVIKAGQEFTITEVVCWKGDLTYIQGEQGNMSIDCLKFCEKVENE